MNVYLKMLLGLLKANPNFLITILEMLVAYLKANPQAEAELIALIESKVK